MTRKEHLGNHRLPAKPQRTPLPSKKSNNSLPEVTSPAQINEYIINNDPLHTMKSKEDTKEEITQNEDKKSMQLGITFEKGIHFAKEPKHTQKTWGLLTHFRDQFWLWKIKKIDRPQTVKTFLVFPFCVFNLAFSAIFFGSL